MIHTIFVPINQFTFVLNFSLLFLLCFVLAKDTFHQSAEWRLSYNVTVITLITSLIASIFASVFHCMCRLFFKNITCNCLFFLYSVLHFKYCAYFLDSCQFENCIISLEADIVHVLLIVKIISSDRIHEKYVFDIEHIQHTVSNSVL